MKKTLPITMILCTLYFVLCTFSNVSAQTDKKLSTNITSATQEGESCLRINPTDSNKMAIGVMRWYSSIDFQIFTSNNAGATWTPSTAFDSFQKSVITTDFPGYNLIGGGDVLLAYDKTGKLYVSWIFALIRAGATTYDSLVFAMYWGQTSDNGQTYTMQAFPDRYLGRGILNAYTNLGYNIWDGPVDRQWMACDLTNGPNANTLYAGFLNYGFNGVNMGLNVRTKAPSSSVFAPPVQAFAGKGQMSNMIVDNNGVLHYVFIDYGNKKVLHCSSADGGATFSTAHVIEANPVDLWPQAASAARYVNNRENAALSFAIDGANNLHIVWNDFPLSTFPYAYYSRSTDGGVTWSTKVELSTPFGNHVFMPTVCANGDKITIGTNVLDNSKISQYYIMTSKDNGATFGAPVKVSTGVTAYGSAFNNFMGDYSTATRNYCKVFNTWSDNRANGPKAYISTVNECTTGIQEITPVNASYTLSNLYPNPANGEQISFDVDCKKSNTFNVSLCDINGKEFLTKELKAQPGTNNFSLDIHDLAAGNYLLKLIDSEEFMTTKVIVKQ